MRHPVDVVIHEEFSLVLREVEKDFPGFRHDLVSDFTEYVQSEGSRCPDYFGRDSIYNRPFIAERAKLRHIHICLPPESFPRRIAQIDRTTDVERPDRDASLIYVRHELYEHQFMIVTFFYPEAHSLGQNNRLMTRLGYIAQQFQDS